MKRLSLWASTHQIWAQCLIALGCILLYTFAVFFGYALLGEGEKIPFYWVEILGVLTFLLSLTYPKFDRNDDRNTLTHRYKKTRLFHFAMFFITGLLFCGIGNNVGQWALDDIVYEPKTVVQSDVPFNKNNFDFDKKEQFTAFQLKISHLKVAIKTHIRRNIERSTHFFKKEKKERSYQFYFGMFGLCILLSYLMAALACAATCSTIVFAAIILVPAALVSITFALIFLIKAFMKLAKLKEKSPSPN
jgi:hypothetical protein